MSKATSEAFEANVIIIESRVDRESRNRDTKGICIISFQEAILRGSSSPQNRTRD